MRAIDCVAVRAGGGVEVSAAAAMMFLFGLPMFLSNERRLGLLLRALIRETWRQASFWCLRREVLRTVLDLELWLEFIPQNRNTRKNVGPVWRGRLAELRV